MSDYFGEARDRMDARAAERADRGLELCMAALGSLALGDREATREALLVLADWWEEVGDVRGPATRALLDKATAGRPHGWSIDTHSRRTVLSGSFATDDGTEAATVRSWDGPTVEADAGGGYDAQVAVLLGGEPFPAPVEVKRATPGTVTLTAGDADPLTLTYDADDVEVRRFASADYGNGPDPVVTIARQDGYPEVSFTAMVGDILGALRDATLTEGRRRRAGARVCNTCRGSGWLAGRRPCPACRGGR